MYRRSQNAAAVTDTGTAQWVWRLWWTFKIDNWQKNDANHVLNRRKPKSSGLWTAMIVTFSLAQCRENSSGTFNNFNKKLELPGFPTQKLREKNDGQKL